jgi:hypothetical protein
MSRQYHHFIIINFIIIQLFSTSHAEITFDGSFGPAITLPEKIHYTIGVDKGRLIGKNLFHSFQKFDINPGESATFTGPDMVANIIGRVTGNHPSHIDGSLK